MSTISNRWSETEERVLSREYRRSDWDDYRMDYSEPFREMESIERGRATAIS